MPVSLCFPSLSRRDLVKLLKEVPSWGHSSQRLPLTTARLGRRLSVITGWATQIVVRTIGQPQLEMFPREVGIVGLVVMKSYFVWE